VSRTPPALALTALLCSAIATAVSGDTAAPQADGARAAAAATGSAVTEQEMADVVRLHNAARADVGVEPLTWAPKLGAFAQEWANALAGKGDLDHRANDAYGENLGINQTPQAAVESWLGEKAGYQRGTVVTADNTDAVGHYTQMVWKATTTVGCGKAVMKRGAYEGFVVLVCNYSPAGNVTGQKPF
jgi:pathogenesis-related protein 1